MKYIITESQYNHLKENKNKKFLIKTMGYDFTDKIKMITSTYDVPMSFDEGVGPNLINRWLNNWGPMYLVNVKGKDYLYQNRGDFEMFIDEEGYDSVDDEITEQLGISDMGLKFSDIIDMFYNEEEPLNESVDKNKRLLINVMGEDLTGKIKQIKSGYDIPIVFRKYLELGGVKKQIDMVGPMYYVTVGGKGYLYQDQSKFYQAHNDASFGEMFMGEDGKRDYSGKVPEQLGVSELGLKFSDIINMFYDEEKSTNMSADDKKIKVMERIIDDVFSEYDWYEGVDTKVETYVIVNPQYRVPDYIFYIMSNDRRQANIDVIEYEDYINEMFNSLFPSINNRVSAVSTIRVA
jgi:antitoxin component of RelBE/YafQ-DinJ toxin-antitoxin module